MSPKFLDLFSFIFLLFSLSCFMINCHSSHSSLIITHENSTSISLPLDFLLNLKGTHKGSRAKGLDKLKLYLNNLGYVKYTTDSTLKIDDFFDDTLEEGIKKYQTFYKLNVSGILDSNTINSLVRPRCGVPDFINTNHTSNINTIINSPSSLYSFLGTVWPPNKRNLTYALRMGTRIDAFQPVKVALNRWSSVSAFKFVYTPDFNNANIRISFPIRDHADGSPFDGPGGVLANAAPPPNGNVQFDGEDDWSDDPNYNQFDIKTVALHEFGHTLGLGHSEDKNAIMYAYFSRGERKDLDSDDIQGIHTLYH